MILKQYACLNNVKHYAFNHNKYYNGKENSLKTKTYKSYLYAFLPPIIRHVYFSHIIIAHSSSVMNQLLNAYVNPSTSIILVLKSVPYMLLSIFLFKCLHNELFCSCIQSIPCFVSLFFLFQVQLKKETTFLIGPVLI